VVVLCVCCVVFGELEGGGGAQLAIAEPDIT
jgi:hypothetical protein